MPIATVQPHISVDERTTKKSAIKQVLIAFVPPPTPPSLLMNPNHRITIPAGLDYKRRKRSCRRLLTGSRLRKDERWEKYPSAPPPFFGGWGGVMLASSLFVAILHLRARHCVKDTPGRPRTCTSKINK